jgi:hypothetical protein
LPTGLPHFRQYLTAPAPHPPQATLAKLFGNRRALRKATWASSPETLAYRYQGYLPGGQHCLSVGTQGQGQCLLSLSKAERTGWLRYNNVESLTAPSPPTLSGTRCADVVDVRKLTFVYKVFCYDETPATYFPPALARREPYWVVVRFKQFETI